MAANEAMLAQMARAQCAAAWYAAMQDDDSDSDEEAVAPKAAESAPRVQEKVEDKGFDPAELAKAIQRAKEQEAAEKKAQDAQEAAEKKAQEESKMIAEKEKEYEKVRAEQDKEQARLRGKQEAEDSRWKAIEQKTRRPVTPLALAIGDTSGLPSSQKIQDRVKELGRAFEIDDLASMRLASAFIERALTGCDLDQDIGLLAEHFATATRPSATGMMMMKDLKAGKPISQCRHYQERIKQGQLRPTDEIAKAFHDGGSPSAPKPAEHEPVAAAPNLANLPAAFRKKAIARASTQSGAVAKSMAKPASSAAEPEQVLAASSQDAAAVAAAAAEASAAEAAKSNVAEQALDVIRRNAERRSTWVATEADTQAHKDVLKKLHSKAAAEKVGTEGVRQDKEEPDEALEAIRRSARDEYESIIAIAKEQPRNAGLAWAGGRSSRDDADPIPPSKQNHTNVGLTWAGGAREGDRASIPQDTFLDRARQEYQRPQSGKDDRSPRRGPRRSRSPPRRGDNRGDDRGDRADRVERGDRGDNRGDRGDDRGGPRHDDRGAGSRRSRSRGGFRQDDGPRRFRDGPGGRSRSRRRSLSGRRHRNDQPRRSRSRPKAEPSLAEAVDAAAAEATSKAAERRKKRSSKWDAPEGGGGGGFGSAAAIAALPTTGVGSCPPVSYAAPPNPKNYKVIPMTGVQIRALLGPRGETINMLRRQSGCDIQVHHRFPEPTGNVSVVGSVNVGEKMIAGILAERGCPLVPVEGLAPGDYEEVPIPVHLVGLFIGHGGQEIKKMTDICGGGVNLKIQPPSTPGGDQSIQIVGPNRLKAKAVIQMKVDAITCGYADKAKPDNTVQTGAEMGRGFG